MVVLFSHARITCICVCIECWQHGQVSVCAHAFVLALVRVLSVCLQSYAKDAFIAERKRDAFGKSSDNADVGALGAAPGEGSFSVNEAGQGYSIVDASGVVLGIAIPWWQEGVICSTKQPAWKCLRRLRDESGHFCHGGIRSTLIAEKGRSSEQLLTMFHAWLCDGLGGRERGLDGREVHRALASDLE